MLDHIASIKDAKLAWEELNNLFGSETKSSKMNLLMKFYHLNKNELDTMTAHINKFKSLKQELARVKKKVEEYEATAMLLNSVDKVPYDC